MIAPWRASPVDSTNRMASLAPVKFMVAWLVQSSPGIVRSIE